MLESKKLYCLYCKQWKPSHFFANPLNNLCKECSTSKTAIKEVIENSDKEGIINTLSVVSLSSQTINKIKDKMLIDHPAHYNQGKYETIDIIEDWKLNFNLGNVIKYISRSNMKGGLEDLKKAQWYLNREVTRIETDSKG